jgi:cell division septum initiation protein DivIVA
MAQQAQSLSDKGWKQYLDLVIDFSTAFIQELEDHTPTTEEVLQRLQQLTSSPEGLALWAHLNKPYPNGLRERTVSTCRHLHDICLPATVA